MNKFFRFFSLIFLFHLTYSQNSGTSLMKELRTNIDPIRSFDLPENAPRARIISTAFLGKNLRNKKMRKKSMKNNIGMTDFNRWKLDELTENEMRSSKEVKKMAHNPFRGDESSETNIGEFFPTRAKKSF